MSRSTARQILAIRVWAGATAIAALLLLVLRWIGMAGFPSMVVLAVFVIAVGWVAITVLMAPRPEQPRRPLRAAAFVANSSGKSIRR